MISKGTSFLQRDFLSLLLHQTIQRRVQKPDKHLRWCFLQIQLTVFSRFSTIFVGADCTLLLLKKRTLSFNFYKYITFSILCCLKYVQFFDWTSYDLGVLDCSESRTINVQIRFWPNQTYHCNTYYNGITEMGRSYTWHLTMMKLFTSMF